MKGSASRVAAACLAGATGLAAVTTAGATDPTAQWCEGVRIAAFPGGPQGGVFANNVYNGFRQAELDLGPKVTYYFSNWDPNTLPTQVKQAIATKVDGIATYGFGGDPATDPLIDQTFAQNDVFTSLNTSLPDAQKKYSSKGFGFVGAPNHDAGGALAAEAVKRASLKSGDTAFVRGLKGQGGDRGQRTIGVVEALDRAGIKVVHQETDSASNADPNAGTATFVGVMKNPDAKPVITDHGGLTSNVPVFARAASIEPGKVFFAGFDMSPNTAQAIEQGYLDLVIDQQPDLQGDLPILNICLTKKFGFSG